MGGSGTGKSTMLNLLNGTIEPKSGKIHINGHKIRRCVEQGAIGYVPQDDLLFEELTVFQNLYFNAKLCFSDFEEKRINSTVNKILRDLDIYEIRDLIVGSPLNKSISGGQRKRLNIALELIREPSVLFVDEPTSGLSSMDSEMVMKLLKEQARKGKLVIVIIHQPSSDIFKLFDKLWILDKGGYPIYNGNPIDAVVYFKTMNTQVNAAESECRTCGNVIAEQILQIIEAKEIDEQGMPTNERKVKPEQWFSRYKEHILPKLKRVKWQTALPPSNFNIPNLLEQFIIFSRRNLFSKTTNTQYILLNLLEPPVLALILAYFSKYSLSDDYVFADNKNLTVYLFMSVVVSLFLGMSISAEEIFKDRKIMVRESFLNLSRLSYLNSKIAFLFVLSAVQTFIFLLVGNWILEIEGMTFSFWLILFSTACFANMMGLNISAGLNSIVTIYILIPLILVPQLLLGGAMIKFDELHHSLTRKIYVPIIGDAMVSRWAYEALAVEQFKNNLYEINYFEYDRQISHAAYQSSFLIPRLERRIDKVLENIEQGDTSIARKDIRTIKNEFEILGTIDGNQSLNRLSDFTIGYFTESTKENGLYYLSSLKRKYQTLQNDANEARERMYAQLIDSLGTDRIQQIKDKNYNKGLANLVQNRDELIKVLETNNRYIQKKDPIFMYPDSKIGRAHFYAPVKIIGSWKIDTLWFNLAMIWAITALFYLALITDALRRSLHYLSRVFRRNKH
ncbi:MAG: ATP-binding cassette domain-containing protein [Bacteroidetes bacterium]|nr:ATP-binding cassette domain-containing protein [Bacteroidota bacterium]